MTALTLVAYSRIASSVAVASPRSSTARSHRDSVAATQGFPVGLSFRPSDDIDHVRSGLRVATEELLALLKRMSSCLCAAGVGVGAH